MLNKIIFILQDLINSGTLSLSGLYFICFRTLFQPLPERSPGQGLCSQCIPKLHGTANPRSLPGTDDRASEGVVCKQEDQRSQESRVRKLWLLAGASREDSVVERLLVSVCGTFYFVHLSEELVFVVVECSYMTCSFCSWHLYVFCILLLQELLAQSMLYVNSCMPTACLLAPYITGMCAAIAQFEQLFLYLVEEQVAAEVQHVMKSMLKNVTNWTNSCFDFFSMDFVHWLTWIHMTLLHYNLFTV